MTTEHRILIIFMCNRLSGYRTMLKLKLMMTMYCLRDARSYRRSADDSQSRRTEFFSTHRTRLLPHRDLNDQRHYSFTDRYFHQSGCETGTTSRDVQAVSYSHESPASACPHRLVSMTSIWLTTDQYKQSMKPSPMDISCA